MASRTLHLDVEVRTGLDRVAQPVVDGMLRLKGSSGRLADASTAPGLVGRPALGPGLTKRAAGRAVGPGRGRPPGGPPPPGRVCSSG